MIELPATKPINDFPVLLFGDFMSQASKENRIYEEITNINKLKDVLQVCEARILLYVHLFNT